MSTCEVCSRKSSDSDDSDMIGGDCAASGRQSTDLTDFTNSPPPGENYFSADGDDVDEDNMPTDAEANKYSFLDRLERYMERALITENNHKAVELVIMVEAGTTMSEMDPMKKKVKKKAFLNSYVSIIQEIPDKNFEHAAFSPAMLLAYKGARKKILEGGTLWRKYKLS
jgi:hypothetical protein